MEGEENSTYIGCVQAKAQGRVCGTQTTAQGGRMELKAAALPPQG